MSLRFWQIGSVPKIASQVFAEMDGLLCRREVLGRSITVQRGPTRYRVDFPDRPDAFNFSHVGPATTEGSTPDPRDYDPTVALVERGGDFADVRLVRITANVESTLSVESFDPKRSADQEMHDQLLHEMRSGSLQLARDLCDWVRLHHEQFWIEPSGRFPRIVSSVELVDIDASRTFGIQIASAGQVLMIDDDALLDDAGLQRIESSLERGSPYPDELFLGEACYLIGSEQVSGPERATLLGAIAVELRVKRALQTIADPAQLMLLDLLLENPHDWTLSAHSMFKKALAVVAGRPMRPDHASLSKRVQKLFESRNALAHRGATIDLSAAREHLQTARDAFEFLTELERQQAKGE